MNHSLESVWLSNCLRLPSPNSSFSFENIKVLMWSIYTSYSAAPSHLLRSFIFLHVSIPIWHVNCMCFCLDSCIKQKVTHIPSAAFPWYDPQLDLRKPFEENWHRILTQALDRSKCCVYWARFSLAHISWVVTLCHTLILSQGCIQNS